MKNRCYLVHFQNFTSTSTLEPGSALSCCYIFISLSPCTFVCVFLREMFRLPIRWAAAHKIRLIMDDPTIQMWFGSETTLFLFLLINGRHRAKINPMTMNKYQWRRAKFQRGLRCRLFNIRLISVRTLTIQRSNILCWLTLLGQRGGCSSSKGMWNEAFAINK